MDFQYTISKMPFLNKLLLVVSLLQACLQAQARGLVTAFSSAERAVVLTFDACESEAPAFFDEAIVSQIIERRIPCVIFLSGKFAVRNSARLKELKKYPFIEFGNHTYNHPQHCEKLSRDSFLYEINRTDSVIFAITGRKTMYFRFPGGNYNKTVLDLAESTGKKVVHWSFASGDPDKTLSADVIKNWVLMKSKPGTILIFHINGRGYKTAQILPDILAGFKRKNLIVKQLKELL